MEGQGARTAAAQCMEKKLTAPDQGYNHTQTIGWPIKRFLPLNNILLQQCSLFPSPIHRFHLSFHLKKSPPILYLHPPHRPGLRLHGIAPFFIFTHHTARA
jgi:hypothetical protein